MANEKMEKEEKQEEKPKQEQEKQEKAEATVPKKDTRKQIIKPKQKMSEAVVHGKDLPISTKHAIAICRFIKNNSIEEAIANLEKVALKRKAVPMKGEVPHRKGMMSGRYPVKAAEQFIKLLKNLAANVSVNGLDIANTKIAVAKADRASRTRYSIRNWKFKRTQIMLVAKEIAKPKENEKSEKKELNKGNKEVK